MSQHLSSVYPRRSKGLEGFMRHSIETETIAIVYETKDESFDHSFGRERKTGHDVLEVKVFIPALNDWMDVTHLKEFEALTDKLIMKELEKAA